MSSSSGASLSLSNVFPHAPAARAALQRHIAAAERNLPALSLPACAASRRVIAPATPSSRLRERFDDRFGTATTSVGETKRAASATGDAAHPAVLYVAAHLVGQLTASATGSSVGFLYLHLPPHRHRTRILIAPAPPPSLRSVPLYIRDWRHLPRTPRLSPVLEVQLRDIVPLVALSTPPQRPVSLAPDVSFKPARRHAVTGLIAARSPIVSADKKRCVFLLELVSVSHNVAVAVVFHGTLVSWWSFVHPGRAVTLTNLVLSKIRRVSKRPILAVTAETTAFGTDDSKSEDGDGDRDSSGGTNIKGPTGKDVSSGEEPLLPHSLPPPRLPEPPKPRAPPRSGAVVDYVGEVSRFLPPDALELDSRVVLHLSDFTRCTAGFMPSRSYRVGTRLLASNVIALRRPMCAPALLATPRTSLDVLFFGGVPSRDDDRDEEVGSQQGDAKSKPPRGWSELRRVAQPPLLAWAGELAVALRDKCGAWFGDTAPSALLGTRDTAGLVQFTMCVLGGPSTILRPATLPVRDMYVEFLHPPRWTAKDFTRPLAPSLHDVNAASTDVGPCVLSHDALAALLCRKQSSSSVSVALVGLFAASSSGPPHVALSDSTAELPVLVPGGLQPSLLGAVVAVQEFHVVVSRRARAAPVATLVFSSTSVRIVVDGPCAAMERDASGGSMAKEEIFESQCPQSQQMIQKCMASASALPASLGAALSSESATGFGATQAMDALFAAAPLVALFVDSVHTGASSAHVCGRLLGCKQSRDVDMWDLVDSDGGGFWRCELHLSGDSMMGVVPAFQEDRVFAVSCTELGATDDDAAANIRYKARQSFAANTGFVLRSKMTDSLPWVENLGSGVYMRFKARCDAGKQALANGLSDNGSGDSLVSQEGEQYIYASKAIAQFQAEADQRVERRLWRLFALPENDDLDEEKVVCFRGVVRDYDEERADMLPGAATTLTPLSQKYSAVAEIGKLTVLDIDISMFDVTVDIFDERLRALCLGLHRGMHVELRDVVRVPQVNGPRFAFVANAKTTLRLLPLPDGVVPQRMSRACCECAVVREHKLLPAARLVGQRYVSEFGETAAASSKTRTRESAAGVVRLDSVQVERVSVRFRPEWPGCVQCGVRVVRNEASDGLEEDEEEELRKGGACTDEDGVVRGSVDVEVVAEMDDGTRIGEVRCRGFAKCARLLRLSADQRMALKRVARRMGHADVQRTDVEPTRDADVHKVWALTNGRRGVDAAAVVAWRDAVARGGGGVVMRSFRMGFGRTVWTACEPQWRRVRLECVGAFDDVAEHELLGLHLSEEAE